MMNVKMPWIFNVHNKIFQCFGLFPQTPNSDSHRPQLTEHLLSGWSALLLVLFSILTFVAFTSDDEFFFPGDNFGYFSDALEIAFAYAAIVTIYSETLLRRGELRVFWRIYLSLARSLGPLGEQSWRCQLRRHGRFLSVFYGLALMEVSFLMIFTCLEDMSRLHLVLFWVTFTPYAYVVHFRNMQCIFHIEVIRHELVALELDLALLADYTKFATRVKPFTGFEEFLRQKIVEKQKIYTSIYEMCDTFQRSFGFSIIAILLMVYVRILVESYFAFYTIYTRWYKVGVSATSRLDNILVVPVLFQIPALLLTSKSCINVVKHITFELHNIQGQVNSPTVSLQIQNFSLQILHQKIRIDGVGVAAMDGYMLTRVVRSIATYMIFFIQFMPKL